MRVIQEHSRTLLDEESVNPVLIVDEAHDLRNEVLATLRVLTNFEMDSRLVVSVILAGQPQLRERLRHMDLECVRSRLTHLATLRLLTREESRDYIKHRLRECGGSDDLFDADAFEAMYGCAQGNLRALDRIAAKSLEVTMHEGASVVGSDQVMTARGLVLP